MFIACLHVVQLMPYVNLLHYYSINSKFEWTICITITNAIILYKINNILYNCTRFQYHNMTHNNLILKIGRFVRLQSESRTAGMPVMSQCRLYATFSIAAISHDFGLQRCTGSAFMLAICFRLPLSVAALHRSVQYDSGSQPGLSM